MSGWFELNKSSDGQFRFVLKAGNGETILTSELYTTKIPPKTVSPPFAPIALLMNVMRRKWPPTVNSTSI